MFRFEAILPEGEIEKEDRHYLMPQGPSFRMLACGRTGSGKTQIAMNLLLHGCIPTTKIYICAKASNQKVYNEFIRRVNETIEEKNEKIREENADNEDVEIEEIKPSDIYEIVETPEELPPIDSLSVDSPTVFVFDDFITDAKMLPLIQPFFTRGRHQGVSSIFLSQSYFDTPKLIRNNCEYFILNGRINASSLQHLHRNLGDGLERDVFDKIYSLATKRDKDDEHPFFFIDTKTSVQPLHFRRNFDQLFLV